MGWLVSRPTIAVEILKTIKEKGELTPEIKNEEIVYPDISNNDEWRETLAELEAGEYVERRVYDRIIKCPNCASTNVRSRYHCPACKSFNLEKTRIIQHTLCGYTGSEIEFRRDGRLVCPRCENELMKLRVDYLLLGWSFECLECRKRTANPIVRHKCSVCKYEFSSSESEYVPVYSYVLTEKGKKAIEEAWFISEVIKESLEEEGYKVEIGGERPGISGLRHRYSLVVEGSKGAAGVDIHSKEELTMPDLLSYMTKTYDTNIPYILVSGKAGEKIKAAGRSYGAIVVDGFDLERLKKVIREVIGEGLRKRQPRQGRGSER